MNYIASNTELFSMANSWTGMTWAGGIEPYSMSQAMVQDAKEVSSSLTSTDVWGWKKAVADVDELLDGSTSQPTTNHSKVRSTSLSSGSGGKYSSSSSSTSSPTQVFDFEENELPTTLKPSKSTSSFSSTSPTFDDFGSMMVSNQNSFTPRLQPTSMTHYGLMERPHSAAPDINHRANREYTETVAVESSACVAQIVGKNGCKIKLLRAKYGVYIHTPVAGEEPVFIIKGRREDVNRIKQEILNTAKHFNHLRASKAAKIENIVNANGSVCVRVHIPDRFVGLVVGRNGWFVKVLQARFNVHIETPKFELRTFFLIYGTEANVHKIIQAIMEHISTKNNNLKLNCRELGCEFFID